MLLEQPRQGLLRNVPGQVRDVHSGHRHLAPAATCEPLLAALAFSLPGLPAPAQLVVVVAPVETACRLSPEVLPADALAALPRSGVVLLPLVAVPLLGLWPPELAPPVPALVIPRVRRSRTPLAWRPHRATRRESVPPHGRAVLGCSWSRRGAAPAAVGAGPLALQVCLLLLLQLLLHLLFLLLLLGLQRLLRLLLHLLQLLLLRLLRAGRFRLRGRFGCLCCRR
mmetsp:Transcript_50155/g.160512  ORF Transcript_50155/g.160512 Transcript_50155/m.160512 type:complete len:225 (+) Transcript_50155:1314-1988(+)